MLAQLCAVRVDSLLVAPSGKGFLVLVLLEDRVVHSVDIDEGSPVKRTGLKVDSVRN
jgi:hypothetical protein